MMVRSPRAGSGQFWRKPAAIGLVTAGAFLATIFGAATAQAAPFLTPKPAAHSTGQVVAAAGHLKATLLPPQPKHLSHTNSLQPLRSMNPAALRAAKSNADAAARQAAKTTAPSSSPKSPAAVLFNGLNRPGLSAADEGYGATPPDSTGAIGPTRYVEAVNQLVGVYDRGTLALLSQSDFATFGRVPAGLNTSDPQIQWDPVANRWLYAFVGIATGNNYLLFGWTKTADPTDLTGGWCNYGAYTGSYLQDYPKLGHDVNFLTVGSNIYDDSKPGFPFVTANIWAFPKPAANDTTCSSAVTATFFADATHPLKNADGSLSFTPVPANTADSGNDYIVSARDVTVTSSSLVMVWHMVAAPGATLVADGDVSVGAAYAMPPGVPQPGTTYLIDSLDGRLTQAVAHFDPSAGAEAVWTQQTVAGSGRSVVRWYEFLPATKTIYQQGVLQNSTDFYFNAAISPTSSGNEASISYNRGSSTLLSMIGAQTRTSATPLGQMDPGELALGSSTAPNEENAFPTNCTQNPCRWGDYSGATPDPSNAHVVWGSNQIDGPVFSGFAQWTTQNFAVSTVPPAPDFSLSASPASQTVTAGGGTSFTVNIAAVGGFSGAVTLSVTGLPSGASGTFNPNPASGASSTLSVSIAAATAAATYPLTITGTSGSLTRTATATLVVTIPMPDFSLTTSPSSQTVTQGAGTSYAIGITPVNGFNGAVTLSVTGLPSGASGTFSPNPVSGASSTLSVSTSASTPAASYPLTITGTSGSLTRTAGATLVVAPTPDFSLSASPSSQTVNQGAGTSYTIAITPANGFSGSVSLSVTGVPSGGTGTFSPNPATGASSTLSVTTAAGTYGGPYALTITGTSGSLTRTTGATLVVNGPAPPPCATASLSPASPTQTVGSTVNFTASSTGCPNPQYEYWVQYLDGSWNMLRPFSTDPTWAWNTNVTPGTYTVHVWANQVGDSTTLSEAIGSSTVNLNGGCTAASISPASATASSGGTVSFTASSSGCPNPQYQYWVQFLDGSWNIQRAFNTDPTWSWNVTGFALGSYAVHVWANQAGASTALGEAIGASTVTLSGGCTSASIVANPTTPQAAGSTFGFTASSTGCANPQYQYWVQYLDGSWNVQRSFSTDPTWSWNTTGFAPGAYAVHVWANQVGDSTTLGEAIGATSVTLTGSCTSASIATSPVASQPVGASFNFTASSSGCSNPQYQYWVQYLDGSWNMLRAFSTNPTWSWNTTGFAPGTYAVHVWANQVGDSTALGEAIGATTVTLTGCTSASIATSPATSQPVGASFNFTASASGCANPQYQYWVQYLDGSWNMLRAFSTNPTWSWNTTGFAPGTYAVHVWANQVGDSTALGEAIGATTVALTGCTSAAIATSPSASQPVGASFKFTASASGCSNPQYQYFVQYLDGSWNMLRAFSTNPVWTWTTTGLKPGAYAVHVWANQVGGSTALGETIGATTVTLTGCTSASISPSTGSARVGSTITFTAGSTGCPNPIYEFWLQDTSGTWRIVQAFGTSSTWKWRTNGLPKGTYNVHVWANQQGSDTSTWEGNGSATFTLT